MKVAVIPRILHRGDHLFRTAEEFHNVYMVRSGAIKTYVVLQSGEEQVIGFHTPGEIVGLDAIDSGRYVCNAMVLDTSCVCPLPYEQLCRLSARSQEVQNRLIRVMSRRIVDHESLLLVLGQKTAEQRLAAFLLHHSNRQRQLGLSEFDINLPMSRADIASYLALAVETVSRVLTRLQDAGLLNVQRSRVRILDLENLAIVAEEIMECGAPAQRHRGGVH
jgi:CRP/FNR family transcriptional regulator